MGRCKEMKNSWLYSSRHLIVNGGPHKSPDLDYIRTGRAWLDYPQAVCATWCSDFDKIRDGNYWFVIKDSPFDTSKLKAKRRYEITKGIRNFGVRVVDDTVSISDELYDVYMESLKGYTGEDVQPMTKHEFQRWISTLGKNRGGHLLFIVSTKETNRICGFAHVILYPEWAAFSTMKTIPEYERLGVNAALVAGILDYLAPQLTTDGFYFSDGGRTLFHQTAFQDYLEKYFLFRKAYCKLNMAINPKYKLLVFIASKMMIFLKPFSCFNLIRGLIVLLKMKKIARI